MTLEDDKAPKPVPYQFVKYPNQWETKLGWFWYKGRKIRFNPNAKWIGIPVHTIKEYKERDDEDNRAELGKSNIRNGGGWLR